MEIYGCDGHVMWFPGLVQDSIFELEGCGLFIRMWVLSLVGWKGSEFDFGFSLIEFIFEDLCLRGD